MTTDTFWFYLQNRLIQTSQKGGQRYSDTSPFSIPWIRYLGGNLAPASHRRILTDYPLAGKAGWENDLSLAQMGSTNSKFVQLGVYLRQNKPEAKN
jgi:hypothetical protein